MSTDRLNLTEIERDLRIASEAELHTLAGKLLAECIKQPGGEAE